MHPPSDVAEGEALIKEVYETIRASPQWNNTLLIINFDEVLPSNKFWYLLSIANYNAVFQQHGGYFDHVPPLSKGGKFKIISVY